MKCIVLSTVQRKRKSDGEPFTISTIAYMRRDKLEVQEKFGLDKCSPGDILNVDTDFSGYVIGYEVVGTCEAASFFMDDLCNLYCDHSS